MKIADELRSTASEAAYGFVHDAVSHYNAELFEGALPPVIVTFHRHGKAFGYYWSKRWVEREGESRERQPEVALTPGGMIREPRETLEDSGSEFGVKPQHRSPARIRDRQDSGSEFGVKPQLIFLLAALAV